MVEELEQGECQDKIDITKDIMMRALESVKFESSWPLQCPRLLVKEFNFAA